MQVLTYFRYIEAEKYVYQHIEADLKDKYKEWGLKGEFKPLLNKTLKVFSLFFYICFIVLIFVFRVINSFLTIYVVPTAQR